jgi:hypothetical protein
MDAATGRTPKVAARKEVAEAARNRPEGGRGHGVSGSVVQPIVAPLMANHPPTLWTRIV